MVMDKNLVSIHADIIRVLKELYYLADEGPKTLEAELALLREQERQHNIRSMYEGVTTLETEVKKVIEAFTPKE